MEKSLQDMKTFTEHSAAGSFLPGLNKLTPQRDSSSLKKLKVYSRS